jgi:hypothetical protein
MKRTTETVEIPLGDELADEWTKIENTLYSFDLQNTSTFIIEYAFDSSVSRGSYLKPGKSVKDIQQDIYIRQRDKHHKVYASITRYYGDIQFGAFGATSTSGAIVNQLIFPDSGYTFYYCNQTIGDSISLRSTSIEDAVGGTGINEIHIHYLDYALNEQVKTVTTTGQTPVEVVITDSRFIQCMHVSEDSVNKYAAGDIIAYKTGELAADFSVSIILAGDTRCSSSLRMVPAGYILFVDGAIASSTSSTADTSANIRIFTTEYGDYKFFNDMARIPLAEIGLQNTAFGHQFKKPLEATAGAVVGGIFNTNKAGKTTMSWFGRLKKI